MYLDINKHTPSCIDFIDSTSRKHIASIVEIDTNVHKLIIRLIHRKYLNIFLARFFRYWSPRQLIRYLDGNKAAPIHRKYLHHSHCRSRITTTAVYMHGRTFHPHQIHFLKTNNAFFIRVTMTRESLGNVVDVSPTYADVHSKRRCTLEGLAAVGGQFWISTQTIFHQPFYRPK